MKYLGRVFNILIWGLVIVLLLQRLSLWQKENQQKGQQIEPTVVQLLQADGTLTPTPLFSDSSRKVLIFWATWCGPCTVELSRVQKLIAKNEIPSKDILAISIQEAPGTVLQALKERKYTFPVALDLDGKIAHDFQVRGTPTTVYLENGKVARISTGLSLLVEKNLKDFLNQPHQGL